MKPRTPTPPQGPTDASQPATIEELSADADELLEYLSGRNSVEESLRGPADAAREPVHHNGANRPGGRTKEICQCAITLVLCGIASIVAARIEGLAWFKLFIALYVALALVLAVIGMRPWVSKKRVD